MSEEVEAFGKIISPRAIVSGTSLEEIDPRGKVITRCRLQFRDIDEWLLWRFNPNEGDLFPFFAEGVRYLKSIADFFLLVSRGDRKYLCIIELKSSSTSAKQQLEASRLFAEYLIASAKRVNLFESNPEIVKVRLVGGKPTTSYRRPSYEKDSGYISYRFPNVFDIKMVLDVFNQEG